jgi:hypothetical protein
MGKLSSGTVAAPQVAAPQAAATFGPAEVAKMIADAVAQATAGNSQAAAVQQIAAPRVKRGKKAEVGPFADDFDVRESPIDSTCAEIFFTLGGVSTKPPKVIRDELSKLWFRYHREDDRPARYWGPKKMLVGTRFVL